MAASEVQLLWFRDDLRVTDQVALSEAARAGTVVAVHCLCPDQLRAHDVGGNRVAFVLRCLRALREDLGELGIPLRVLTPATFDDVPDALLGLAHEVAATTLWFNEEYPLNEWRRDAEVQRRFEAQGLSVERRTDSVIQAPGTVRTNDGGIYTVFTPFMKRWRAQFDPDAARPRAKPARQTPPGIEASAIPRLPEGFEETCDGGLWPGGEAEALRRLEAFVEDDLARYDDERDFPALDGTSRLSAYLAVGAISPRTALDAALAANVGRLDGPSAGASTWISELIWREFYRHVMHAFPHVARGHAFRREYDDFRWRGDDAAFEAWCAGRTGFPLIDAAMRQLVAEGWMHNRLRMVVAMFLSKNLLLDWRRGERFFLQHLVDGDFAANNGGWQWSASTGTDAAPYFRIFSPVSQSQRFDPECRFVTHWLPELAGAPPKAIHDPARGLGVAGYPDPIVDAKASRQRAIEAFRAHG
jgi:deoxyribodipyrimidine photo-lyase